MPDITAGRPVSGQPIETAWGDQVHDAIEGIQTGKVAATWTGVTPFVAGPYSITFPRAYTAAPAVFVQAVSASTDGKFSTVAYNVTATGMQISSRRDGGSSGLTGELHWIAIGTPA